MVLPELEQVRIPGNDEISFGRYRAGKHVIVVGVAKYDGGDRWRMHELRKLSVAQNQAGNRKRLLCDLTGEFCSREDAFKLDQQGRTGCKLDPALERFLYQPIR